MSLKKARLSTATDCLGETSCGSSAKRWCWPGAADRTAHSDCVPHPFSKHFSSHVHQLQVQRFRLQVHGEDLRVAARVVYPEFEGLSSESIHS